MDCLLLITERLTNLTNLKKKKDQGNFWRSFFLNYIILVISKVEKLLLPGILDQIELKKREYTFFYSLQCQIIQQY